ncbi:MAG: AMP-binding protein [Pseudomonadota bacterium]
MARSSLLTRDFDGPIAWLTRDTADFKLHHDRSDQAISRQRFLQQANWLSQRLPDTPAIVNEVDNRYLFLLTLCAASIRGITCLLPQNRTPAVRTFLGDSYPDAVSVYDGRHREESGKPEPPGLNVSELPLFALRAGSGSALNPAIADDHVAVVCFTSGSTGDPKPLPKTWRILRESSRVNYRYFCSHPQSGTSFHYAGVPPQHMWGLETSVFLPLFADVCTVDAHAELPGDLIKQFSELPRPLTFIGTPLHLRALMATRMATSRASAEAGRKQPITLDRVLCATSPLDEGIAAAIEEQFATQVHEVYGCSEVGSMAHRRTAKDALWTRFEGMTFQVDDENLVQAGTEYLGTSFTLGDRLEFVDSTHFRLAGRSDDLVKIAGKRGSLAAIHKVLFRYPALVDGAVFHPVERASTTRLAAIVSLSSEGDLGTLKRYLATHLDSTFVPRPIYVVDALPRQANGKLPQGRLLELYERLNAGD